MVFLVDWTEHVFFNTNKAIKSIKNSFLKGIDKILKFKWFLKHEGEKSKKVNFKVLPANNALKFPKTVMFDKSKTSVFVLKIDAEKMPKFWRGELLIEVDGVTSKVPMEFEKRSSVY